MSGPYEVTHERSFRHEQLEDDRLYKLKEMMWILNRQSQDPTSCSRVDCDITTQGNRASYVPAVSPMTMHSPTLTIISHLFKIKEYLFLTPSPQGCLCSAHCSCKSIERVESFNFFGVHILADITWTAHNDFPQKVKAQIPPHLLTISQQ